MAVSLELLNTTLQDFKGPIVNTYSQQTPTRELLMKKGKISSEGGTYVERGLMTGSPSKGTGIYGGDETLDRTRYKKAEKFRVDFHRVVVPIVIPNKELKQNSGKLAVIKMIENYPKAVADGLAIDDEKFWLTGKTSDMVFASEDFYGFSTLNGQFASGNGTGVEFGFLEFAAAASQTNTLQNVAKSEAARLYNQYGDITGWSTDGEKVLRQVYRRCAQFCGRQNGGPDLMIMDDDTFANYTASKKDIVRLVKVSDQTDKGNLLTDVFALASVYGSVLIDLAADFTGVAQDGVTYMVDTNWLEIVQLEKPTLSDFVDAGSDQDGVVAKMAMHEARIFQKPAAHGCVSGGAT